ncbi:hypothetical protein [Micromonospora sonneratiae]|uniref:DUF4177 domain-containing protein n=1 Tax=Micromonospora sonneratiae TaxID=1184706 RepID=A0ABW3YA03_9ACTN
MQPQPQRPPRIFYCTDILSGRASLDGYPFRYVLLRPPVSSVFMAGPISGDAQVTVDQMLSAVELLETRGWELVNFEQGGLLAFLRRARPH